MDKNNCAERSLKAEALKVKKAFEAKDHFPGASKMVAFDKWLEKRRISLKPWQYVAAVALLSVMYHHRDGGSGKTFMVRVIGDFLNEHGNDFELV